MFVAVSFGRFTQSPQSTEENAVARAVEIARTTQLPACVLRASDRSEICVVHADGKVVR